MTAIFWLGVVGLVVFILVGLAIVGELKQIRGVLAGMLGSVAQANWRTRDEIAAIAKSRSKPT